MLSVTQTERTGKIHMRMALNFKIKIVLLIFVVIFAHGVNSYAGEVDEAVAKQETATADVSPETYVLNKCPKCGEVLSPGHEHAEKEEEKSVSAGADLCFYDKYVWRGLILNDDPVFQPDVWFSYKGFTLNIWANMDLTDFSNNKGEINEIDYTVEYSLKWEPFNLTAGVVHYSVPNTHLPSTSEVYGTAGYDVLLQPTLTVYYEFQQADGFYGELGVSHGFELPKFSESIAASLDLSAQVGLASKNWNSFNYGADHTAFTNVLLTAGVKISAGDHLSVTPTINYSSVIDGALRSKVDKDHALYWGVTISASL